MSVSRYCIDRPIFASVVSIVIVIAGAAAMLNLPVAQYPDIAPVTVSVGASYPGAAADVISNSVVAPMEQQINGADHMLYMESSSSSSGNASITAYFEIGTSPELAQVDVQNRVNLALPTLPDSVQKQGVAVQKRSGAFMMVIAIYSPDDRYDSQYIANYANLYVLDSLKRIPGAGQTSIFGAPDLAMRIWLKPDRMAQLGVTAADVQRAVANQNQQFAVGSIGASPTGHPVEQSFAVTTVGRMTDPSEFENIILRAGSDAGAIVRLRDVGRAELGQRDYSVRSTLNGKAATVMAVYQQPGANALEVSGAVTKALTEMRKSFPDGIDYAIAMDTTQFTRASIETVVHTFFEGAGARRPRRIPVPAELPCDADPDHRRADLDRRCGDRHDGFGFSINMLTLFGMVLAIGIVVDDAIVVIESVEHNMSKFGMSPKEAAKKSMDEVGGALVAIVLVLCAVFVPVAFVPGVTGQLYKQFAITIAIAVVISGIVALTLSPALAALLLKPAHHEKKGFFRWFENAFARMTVGYTRVVKVMIKRSLVALLLFAGMIAICAQLFRTIPSSFLPPEDQGYLLGAVIMPDAASLDRTADVSRHATDYFTKNPASKAVVVIDGFSLLDGQVKSNAAVFFVGLKDFSERYSSDNIRTQNARAVLTDAFKTFSTVREGIIVPINPPSIPGLGTTGGLELYIQAKGDGGIDQTADVIAEFVAKARQRPELANVTSTFNATSQQLLANVDREKAEILGVPVEDVYSTMSTMFGSLYVSQFNRSSRLWQVIVQAEPSYRLSPDDLDRVYVRSKGGSMVPLKAIVTTQYATGPSIVTRFNNFPAVKLTANTAAGFSSGQAIAALEETAAELPSDYGLAWTGEALEEKKSGGASVLVFVFGLVMVFLILAGQYEKWSLPFGVLLAVPFALFGRAAVDLVARAQQRRLFPDRADDARRTRCEECDPDLRVRGDEPRFGADRV
jgi:multidrug efflux pump